MYIRIISFPHRYSDLRPMTASRAAFSMIRARQSIHHESSRGMSRKHPVSHNTVLPPKRLYTESGFRKNRTAKTAVQRKLVMNTVFFHAQSILKSDTKSGQSR